MVSKECLRETEIIQNILGDVHVVRYIIEKEEAPSKKDLLDTISEIHNGIISAQDADKIQRDTARILDRYLDRIRESVDMKNAERAHDMADAMFYDTLSLLVTKITRCERQSSRGRN